MEVQNIETGPHLLFITLMYQFLPKSLFGWYNSPGTSTPAQVQNDLTIGPGLFGVENSFFRLMLFFFEES